MARLDRTYRIGNVGDGRPPSQDETDLVACCTKQIERAKQDRERHKPRIADCYKFALPWRHRFDNSTNTATSTLDEIFDDTAMTVAEDFAADMLNTFTPMKQAWTAFKPSSTLPSVDQAALARPIKEYAGVLFAEMRRSNLFQALQECYLDLYVGTMAMTVTDINPAEPLHCEAIPAPELLLSRGLYGRVDGIYRQWFKMRGEQVAVLWPRALRPSETAWKMGDAAEYDVIDGVYRDWSVPATERWVYVVMYGGRCVYHEEYEGKGSNPFIIGRWSRDSTTAWGVGPLYRTVTSVKVLNYLTERVLKAVDKNVDPAVSYVDDGVINLDQGVTPGMWVPRGAGSEAPEPIESKAKFDVAFVQSENLVHDIKRAAYQDRPEQVGKTPPSASQWNDEAAERARRMGTPATNLVHEWQYGIIYRFAYLLAKRGVLPKVELNGKEIALEPDSPLLRAQQQEEVVRLGRFAEMIGAYFGPQIANVVIDVPAFVGALAQGLSIDPSLVNSEDKLRAAMQQLAPILGQIGWQTGKVAPNAPAAVP